jgi:DNA-binding MarR family transcriptional regulator
MYNTSVAEPTRKSQRKVWPPIYAPQAQLSYWLRLADTHYSEDLEPELKGCSIIASEWTALRELYRPGRLSPSDVARAIGMTKGGTSKLLDRLIQKGLVEKRIGHSDRRFRTVELTEDGRYLVQLLAFSEERADRRFFRRLRLSGRCQLLKGLKRTLGAETKKYMDEWISLDGQGGQWVFQAAWRSRLRQQSLSPSTSSSYEQSLQFLRGQLPEASTG